MSNNFKKPVVFKKVNSFTWNTNHIVSHNTSQTQYLKLKLILSKYFSLSDWFKFLHYGYGEISLKLENIEQIASQHASYRLYGRTDQDQPISNCLSNNTTTRQDNKNNFFCKVSIINISSFALGMAKSPSLSSN